MNTPTKSKLPVIAKSSFLHILMLLTVVSCMDNSEQVRPAGNLTITFQAEEHTNGRDASVEGASYVFITIEDGGKNIVLDKKLPVIGLNEGYITESVSLPSGDYTVTRFLILDKEDNAIFGTPVLGSNYAYLVDDNLPLPFAINPGQATSLPLDVISLKSYSPSEIGYASLQFNQKCALTTTINGESVCVDKASYLIAYASVPGEPSVFSLRTPFFSKGDRKYNLSIETTEFTGPGTYTLKPYNGGSEFSTYGYLADLDVNNKRMIEYASVSGTLVVESVAPIKGTSNGLAKGTFSMTAVDDQGHTVTVTGSFNKLRGMGWWEE